MITWEDRQAMTVPEMEARALDERVAAMLLWDEWEALGRPADRTNDVLKAPRGWLAHIIDAQDWERAAQDQRWRMAVESHRWCRTPALDPNYRRVFESAYWGISDGRTRPVHRSVASRELAVRAPAPLVPVR